MSRARPKGEISHRTAGAAGNRMKKTCNAYKVDSEMSEESLLPGGV